ncbi:MAG: DUF2924 domain-containing protein [Pseudomonadales bacterium]
MSDLNLPVLETLSRPQIKVRWTECFGKPPPDFFYARRLIQGIAYKQQVLADPELQRLEQRARRHLRRSAPTGALPQHVRLHPGARLLRDWNGATYEVTVTEAGFRYRERSYSSLSAIAREITGTRWSGPAFFGLTR